MTTDYFTTAETLYDKAIEYLDDNYAFFLTNVLNAGKPRWDHTIPTAAVVVPKSEAHDRGHFEFVFNPEFANKLTAEQVAFVLAHECLHVLLYHLTLSLNFYNKEIFNIAADCVINDFLSNAGLISLDGICRGEDVVGFDCSNSTVTEVYNVIENNPDIQEKFGIGTGESQLVSIDDHSWMHDPQSVRDFMDAMSSGGFTPDQLPSDLEEILNETINEYEKTKMAGRGTGREEYMREQKITLKWTDLLEKVNPDMFRAPGAGPKPITSFRKTRRKLAGMSSFSDALLPSLETPDKGPKTSRSDRKPHIVLALDTSGSIGQDTANKFLNLAKSIPTDKIEVSACTFQDNYMPLDLDNPKWRSGGTDFSPIETFIQKHVIPINNNKYPSAVVVVTDGYASFYRGDKPSAPNAKNWTWLLLDNRQVTSAKATLSQFGFPEENFDCLNGFVDGKVNWNKA